MMRAITRFIRIGSSCVTGAALVTAKLATNSNRLTPIAIAICFLFAFTAASPFMKYLQVEEEVVPFSSTAEG
jgi:hypothetical protein